MKKSLASITVAASLLAGGAGAVIFAPVLVSAQSETDTTTADTTTADSTTAQVDRSTWLADALQTLVDDGTLTQAQADTVESTLKAARPEGGHGGRGHGLDRGQGLDQLSTMLGLDAAEIRTALEGGQSLADIAAAQGIDPQTLIDSMVANAQTRIDEAVAAGRLDETEAAERLAEATQRATDMVNGDFELGAMGGHGPGRHGHGADEAAPDA